MRRSRRCPRMLRGAQEQGRVGRHRARQAPPLESFDQRLSRSGAAAGHSIPACTLRNRLVPYCYHVRFFPPGSASLPMERGRWCPDEAAFRRASFSYPNIRRCPVQPSGGLLARASSRSSRLHPRRGAVPVSTPTMIHTALQPGQAGTIGGYACVCVWSASRGITGSGIQGAIDGMDAVVREIVAPRYCDTAASCPGVRMVPSSMGSLYDGKGNRSTNAESFLRRCRCFPVRRGPTSVAWPGLDHEPFSPSTDSRRIPAPRPRGRGRGDAGRRPRARRLDPRRGDLETAHSRRSRHESGGHGHLAAAGRGVALVADRAG